jgi:hypothetical protein
MNEKDIFSLVDDISENGLKMIMNEKYTKEHIENSNDDCNEKVIIRAKLYDKIRNDTVLNLKRKSKKSKVFKKNNLFNNIMKSVVAAMLVFVVSVNVFPSVALALVKIPGFDKLIKIVTFDKGFKNVIENGNIQQVNTTIEDKGIKFTVTEIAGDDLKIWIGYEIESEDLRLGQIIKFKNKTDGKDLPWIGYIPEDGKNYIEVHMDRLVKDFEMEIDVYKDDPSFHTVISGLDEKSISDIKKLYEKNKITTLNIPISLNDKIYNNDLRVFNLLGKEFKSGIGTFRIEKLELADSRSRVYCKLLSEKNELVQILVPRLIDGEGKNFSSPNISQSYIENNTLCLELSGGITSIKGLRFTCNGFKYINKQNKFVTIDLMNKQIEPNNLGISLIDIDSSNIILKVPGNGMEFNFEAKNEKGKTVRIKQISGYSLEVRGSSLEKPVKFKFNELKDKKIILKVDSVQYDAPRGFEMRLID